MSKTNKLLYASLLLLADITAFYISITVAYQIRIIIQDKIPPLTKFSFTLTHLYSQVWILGIVISFLLMAGLYHKREPLWLECGRILKAFAVSLIVILAIVSIGRLSHLLSRSFVCIMWLILPPITMLLRGKLRKVLHKNNTFRHKAIIIADDQINKIANRFEEDTNLGINIVKKYNISELTDAEILKRLNKLDLKSLDLAIIAAPEDSMDRIMPLYTELHRKLAKLLLVPNSISLTNAETVQMFSSRTGYLYITNSLMSPLNRAIKRVFDLLIVICIVPFAIPIIGLLALLVKATSPGAAIFKHERMGRDGKPFYAYKMRSMYSNSQELLERLLNKDEELKKEWTANFKLKRDPRITPIGKFLRKTSLDELPQLFNIILGHMSFIGPRPVLRKELEVYYKENAAYYNMSTPGITGLWQVSGRSDTSYEERVYIDSWYVTNWSLWLDIVILLSTPIVVILRRGAY